MIWQEAVWCICAVWYVLTLLPAMRDARTRIPLKTSISNILMSFVLVVVDFSLSLYWLGTVNIVAGAQWIFLSLFRRPTP